MKTQIKKAKKASALLFIFLLLCPPVFGETVTVTAINATIGGQSEMQVEAGTVLTAVCALSDGETLDHWEINGAPAKESFGDALVFRADGPTLIRAVAEVPKETIEIARRKSLLLRAVGAVIRFQDSDGKPAGEPLTQFEFGEIYTNPVTGEVHSEGSIDFYIEADAPKGKTIDCWVINGIPFHFSRPVRGIYIKNLTQGATIEAVVHGGEPTTALLPREIKEQRTAPQLSVQAISAKMRFLKKNGKPAGRSFDGVDFSRRYKNLATNRWQDGGSVSLKVQAALGKKQTFSHWRFNDILLRFDPAVTDFTVYNLNIPMVFTAVPSSSQDF